MGNENFPFVVFGDAPKPGGSGGRNLGLIEGGSGGSSNSGEVPATDLPTEDDEEDDGVCRRMDCLIGLRGRVGASFMSASSLGQGYFVGREGRLIEGVGDLKPNNENTVPDFWADKTGGVSPSSESASSGTTTPTSSDTWAPSPTPLTQVSAGRSNPWLVITSLLLAVMIGWGVALWRTGTRVLPWPKTEATMANGPIVAPVPPEFISLGEGEDKKVRVRFADVPPTPAPPSLPRSGAESVDPLGDTVWVDKEGSTSSAGDVVLVPSTPTPVNGEFGLDDGPDDEESGGKDGATKKKNRQRSKAKKRKAAALSREEKDTQAKEEGVEVAERVVEMHLESDSKVTEPVRTPSSLIVSEDVLGKS
jgi:hypothetical protein